MEKVLVSKEQAEALESAHELSGWDKSQIVQWHATELFDEVRAPLNEMSLDTVCRALYVGYEVEPGPEEKILKMYKSYPSLGHTRNAIEQTLNLLNKQIKGINC